jgi:hypothetical protein
MKSRQTMLALTVAAAASVFATSASAAIMTTPWQTQTTNLQGTTGAVTNLTFDQYNAADFGGFALHDVEFECTSTAYAVYQFTDLSGVANEFTFQAELTAKGTYCEPIVLVTDQTRTVPGGGTYTSPGFGPPADFQAGLTATDVDNQYYDVNSPEWAAIAAAFAGAGTVNVANSATIANQTASSGDNSTTLLSRYETTMRLRYSYVVPDQQMPEPVTLGLFGLGLAGIALASRRRKANAV